VTIETNILSDIVNNLRRVFQVLVDQSKNAEEETGLTSSQLWAMKEIAAAGSLKGAELARRMFIHPATVVNLVDRLEERGLVVRVRSQKDRRVVDIELTAKGTALVRNSPEVAQDVLVKGLGKLPDNDVSQIAEGLKQLVEVLGAENEAPRMIMSGDSHTVMKGMRSQERQEEDILSGLPPELPR
jgi:DNA-binding MarR family transcriptional regulator